MKYTKTKHESIYTYNTKNGKRYYVRRAYTINGQRKEATRSNLQSLQEAKIALAEIIKDIDENLIGINTEMTVEEYWNVFYDKRIKTGRWTPNTEVYYVSVFNNHILPKYGKVKLKHLERNEYETFLNKQLKERPKATVKIFDSCFMAMLNDAVLNGNITQNRLKQVYLGEGAKPPANKKITLEQFKIWMAQAENMMSKKYFAFTYLSIFGLRRGEVFGLRAMDVDFKNGLAVLHLRHSRANHTQKGRAGLKTKKSERFVTLDEKGTELVRYLIDETERIKKKLGIIKNREKDYISLHEDGRLIDPNRLNIRFCEVSKSTGIHVTPHMLRHFFTTQGVIAGVPIEHLGRALGHTSSYMTERYTQIQDEVSASVSAAFIESISKAGGDK